MLRLSTTEAFILFIIAVACLYLGFTLFFERKRSRYPALIASYISTIIGIWILNNAYIDRSAITQIIWPARISFVLPAILLVLHLLFTVKFPPANKKRGANFIIATAIIVSIGISFAALHPQGILTSTHPDAVDRLQRNFVAYYLALGGYFTLLLASVVMGVKKWKVLASAPDHRVFFSISFGAILATALTAIFSLLNATLAIRDPYLYFYSSLAMPIYSFYLGFAVLKYGALNVSLPISKLFLSILFLTGFLLLVVIALG